MSATPRVGTDTTVGSLLFASRIPKTVLPRVPSTLIPSVSYDDVSRGKRFYSFVQVSRISSERHLLTFRLSVSFPTLSPRVLLTRVGSIMNILATFPPSDTRSSLHHREDHSPDLTSSQCEMTPNPFRPTNPARRSGTDHRLWT